MLSPLAHRTHSCAPASRLALCRAGCAGDLSTSNIVPSAWKAPTIHPRSPARSPWRARGCQLHRKCGSADRHAADRARLSRSGSLPEMRKGKGVRCEGLFESRSSSHSTPPGTSLPRYAPQKNALFQKGLPERPATALPARRPFLFSFWPVSPKGRDFANLVTGRGFVSYQLLEG
jgi:hypothetical protein